MAITVVAIASSAAAYGVAGAVTGAVIAGVTISALGAAIIGGVVGMAVGGALTSVLGLNKPKAQQGAMIDARNTGQVINVVLTDEPIPVYYGVCRNVPGIISYRDVAGGNNVYLYMVIVVGEGEIEAFDATYIGNVLITDARYTGLYEIEYHTGADAQAASTLLTTDFPTKFSASDIGGGIAYAVVKLTNNPVYAGQPVFSFDIRGKKVKDTRDSVTRFSNNPALCIRDFWTNTRYGRKVAEAKMVDAKISTEASYCDERLAVPAFTADFTASDSTEVLTFEEDVPFDDGDGVTLTTDGTLPAGTALATTYYWIRTGARTGKLATTYANALARTAVDITDAGTGTHTAGHVDRPRYTCNGGLDPSADPYENLRNLRSSCRSWLFTSGGLFHLVIDKPTTPSSAFEFTEHNIIGQMNIDMGEEDNHFNRVMARFLDTAKGTKPNFAISDNATERTADGGKLMEGIIQLDFTTNFYMAEAIAQIERRKSRVGIKVVHKVSIAGFQAMCGEVYYHTHSMPAWVQQPLRLMRIDVASHDEYEVELHEYDADVYTLDAQTAIVLPDRTTLPNPSSGLTIAGLALASGTAELFIAGDGTVVSRIKATWTAITNQWVLSGGRIEMQYKKSADAIWINSPAIEPSLSTAWAGPVDDGVNYDVRLRAVNTLGVEGAWASVTAHTVVGKTAAPADVTGFVAAQVGGLVQFACDPVTDADLDRVEVRLLDFGDTNWNNGIAKANILRGQTLPTASVPPGTWTLLAKAFDTSGNESATAARFDLEVSAEGFTTIVSNEEATDWLGTLSNFVRHPLGALVPDSQSLASALGWEVFDEFVPNPFTTCTYTAPELDKGIDGTARVYIDVVSALGPGVSSGQASPSEQIDYKESAGAYDGYEDWHIGTPNFRYVKGRVVLDTSVGLAKITGMAVVVDNQPRQENGIATIGGGGSAALVFDQEFHVTPTVQVTPQGSGDVAASYDSVTTTGFTAYFKSAGVAAAGVVSYTVTGV